MKCRPIHSASPCGSQTTVGTFIAHASASAMPLERAQENRGRSQRSSAARSSGGLEDVVLAVSRSGREWVRGPHASRPLRPARRSGSSPLFQWTSDFFPRPHRLPELRHRLRTDTRGSSAQSARACRGRDRSSNRARRCARSISFGQHDAVAFVGEERVHWTGHEEVDRPRGA